MTTQDSKPDATTSAPAMGLTFGRQRIAIGLQGGTLLLLLGIGSQAKEAFDTQFEQQAAASVQFEVRARELAEKVTAMDNRVTSIATELQLAAPAKLEVRIHDLEVELARMHALEEVRQDKGTRR